MVHHVIRRSHALRRATRCPVSCDATERRPRAGIGAHHRGLDAATLSFAISDEHVRHRSMLVHRSLRRRRDRSTCQAAPLACLRHFVEDSRRISEDLRRDQSRSTMAARAAPGPAPRQDAVISAASAMATASCSVRARERWEHYRYAADIRGDYGHAAGRASRGDRPRPSSDAWATTSVRGSSRPLQVWMRGSADDPLVDIGQVERSRELENSEAALRFIKRASTPDRGGGRPRAARFPDPSWLIRLERNTRNARSADPVFV